jgi:hypothetical protein
VGIDLELADCAAAGYRLVACRSAGPDCRHSPDCALEVDRLLAAAARDRPGEDYPSEFRYRRFGDINEKMLATGMGFTAAPAPFAPGPDDDLAWRAQIVPGRTGIPSFKLESNDRWVVTAGEIDEALDAYAGADPALRTRLESEEKWRAWLSWLAVARNHGGFEAE